MPQRAKVKEKEFEHPNRISQCTYGAFELTL